MSPSDQPPTPPESIDEIDGAIVRLAARINTATHDLLVLVRRFDERCGWLKWGFANCAEWLAWRCDLGLNAAREKVRVAHALKTLPAIGTAFARGELSYSKVRALTRVADRDNEDALLAFALGTTAARVDERCRELRYGTDASLDDALRGHARRALSLRRDPARGTMILTAELPLETGELLDRALDTAIDNDAASSPEFAEQSWSALRADALVALARAWLAGGADVAGEAGESAGASGSYRVTVHVDHAALRDGRGRAGLPVETARRLACDGERVVIVEDGNGEPLDIGRKTRAVPTAIRRALWARDRGCRFPGCAKRRYVDAHHVEHWSQGGATSLANLVLLCDRHHRLVHEGGYSIDKDFRDRWFFRRPDGRAVPEHGYAAADMRDDDDDDANASANADASANANAGIDPELTGVVNNPPAGGSLTGNAGSANGRAMTAAEPPPPNYLCPGSFPTRRTNKSSRVVTQYAPARDPGRLSDKLRPQTRDRPPRQRPRERVRVRRRRLAGRVQERPLDAGDVVGQQEVAFGLARVQHQRQRARAVEVGGQQQREGLGVLPVLAAHRQAARGQPGDVGPARAQRVRAVQVVLDLQQRLVAADRQ